MTMMMFYGGAPLQWWPVARPALCRTIERLPTNTSFVKRCHLHQYVQYLYLFQSFVRPPSSNSDIYVDIENQIRHSHTKKMIVYRDHALSPIHQSNDVLGYIPQNLVTLCLLCNFKDQVELVISQ